MTSTADDALVGYAVLADQGHEVITGTKENAPLEAAVFAITRGGRDANVAGFVAVFGDSNCLESVAKGENRDCFWLVDALLDCAVDGDLPPVFRDSLHLTKLNRPPDAHPPKRITTGHFAKYSKVINGFKPDAEPIFRALPSCKKWPESIVRPVYNLTLPSYVLSYQFFMHAIGRIFKRFQPSKAAAGIFARGARWRGEAARRSSPRYGSC